MDSAIPKASIGRRPFLVLAIFVALAAMVFASVSLLLFAADDSSAAIADDWSYEAGSGVLIYKGPDEMPDYTETENPITVLSADKVLSIEFSSKNVKKIGAYAFYNSKTLITVTIPSTVLMIGDCAFKGCISLTTISIPIAVEGIGDSAFEGCTSIEEVSIPAGLLTINKRSFYGCTSLTTVSMSTNVLAISDSAFQDCSKLSSFMITDSVISIGKEVFSGCSSLVSVSIGTGLRSLGERAFLNCTSLVTMEMTERVTAYGAGLFYGCTSLESVVIGTGCSSISDSMFRDCSSLREIQFNTSIRAVGDYAFSGCTGLFNVMFKDSENKSNLRTIGEFSFENCTSLTKIDLPAALKTIDDNAFKGCSYLYEVCNESELNVTVGSESNGFVAYYALRLIKSPNDSIVEIIYDTSHLIGMYSCMKIGNDLCIMRYVADVAEVETPTWIDYKGTRFNSYLIYDNAFKERDVLTSVSITGAVESVGASSFRDCMNLTTLNIFMGPRSIGDYAFSGCVKVKSAVIPGSVDTIGFGVFSGCTSMTSAEISNSLTVISESAFEGCTALKTVSTSNTLVRIEAKAFQECSSLETTSFPATLEYIGDYSFKGCRALKTAEFESALVHIGDYAFDRCISLKTVILPRYLSELGESAFVNCSSLKEVSMGSEVVILRNDTFRGCSSLERISLSENITMIEDNAFYNCSSLKSVRLPSELISIGQSAFYNCSSLTYISLPNNLATVGGMAFYNCSAMGSVTVEVNVVSIGDMAFYNCTQLKKVVNRGFLSLKIGSTDYGYIAYYAETIEGEINEYTVENMRVKCNNSSMDCVLLQYTGTATDLNIKTVEVEGDIYKVVSIGAGAFQNCLTLKKISFPVVLSSIEDSAFKGCINLVSAPLEGTSIMFIGSHAFEGCYSLEDVIIPETVLTISDYAYKDCSSVRNVAIMDGPAAIGKYAFSGCSALINLSIGTTVETIGDYAFQGCAKLSEIVLPTGLRTIGLKVFIGCTSLRTISINESNRYFTTSNGVLYDHSLETLMVYPAGKTDESFTIPFTVLNIADSSFYGNTHLLSVNLHDSIRSIGASAFSGCSGIILIDLKYVSNIGSDALYGCTALTRISVNDANESYSTDGGVLYTKDMAVLIVYPSAKTDNIYTIRSETVVISDHAFNRCLKLNNLTIPASVGSIGVNSMDCPKLTTLVFRAVNCSDFSADSNVFANAGIDGDGLSVEFAFDVVHIPAYMFCVSGAVSPKIVSMTIGANVASIGKMAFGGTANLSTVNFLAMECADLDRDSEVFSGAGVSGNGITITFGEMVNRVPSNLFHSASVPNVVNVYIGDNVVTVGTNAFVNCDHIKTVYIGLGVEKIGDFAFFGTIALESVQFHAEYCNNLTAESNVFNNSGITGKGISVTIGDSVTNVPAYMFYTNSKLTTPNLISLKLGLGILHIGDCAFYNCANLNQLTIPGMVTSIGSNAFTNCSGLKELTLGGAVTVIGSQAFSDCLSIEKFTYYPQACNDLSKNDSSFMNMGISGDGVNVTIANTVTKVPANLFYEVTGSSAKITKLTIGSGVSTIGTNAFYGLEMLNTITFNAKKCLDLTSLSNVFYDAGTMGEGITVRVGDGVMRIPAYLMYVGDENHAPYMTSLIIGTGVASIGNCAFYNSVNLTSVEYDAINCSDLRSTSNVFYGAGNAVQGIYLSIGDSVERIPTCLFYVNKSNPEGSKLLSISIGRGVSSIGDCAFYNSPNLMSINYFAMNCADLNYSSNIFFDAGNRAKELYLTFGDSVRSLPSYLFFVDEAQYSPNIHTINIHENTKHIGTSTFASCSAVTEISIGSGVTDIGPNAFKDCVSVKSITFSAISCKDLQYSSNVFFNVGTDEGMSVKIADGVTKVPDYLFYVADSKYSPRVTDLTIGDIVDSIGNNAFSSCAMLRTVYLGEDLTSIGSQAFYMCPSLSELKFNCASCGNLISSSNVFFDCGESSGGLNVTFGDKVKRIPSYLFYSGVSGHQMNIKSLVIGPNVKDIGAYSLSRCSIKGDLVITDNIENIGKGAFSDCSMIDSITIGANVKLIESLAFSGCTSVTSLKYNAYDCSNFTYDSDVFMDLGKSKDGVNLVIGNGVKKIPAYLCCASDVKYSPNITSITIPSTVLSIGSYAFSDCTNIKSVIYNAETCIDVQKSSNIFRNAGRSADGMDVSIGNGVKTVPANLFNIDDGLCYPKVKTVTIGTSVAVIGERVFNNCAELEMIKYNAKQCSSLVYEDAPFSNVGMKGNGTSIVIGDSVRYIPDYLFCNTPEMGISKFSSLTLSSSVEEIGSYSFAGCSGFSAIDLPKTLRVIGNGAFYGCSAIQTISIGEDVSSLGFAAFGRCSSLEDIVVDADNEHYTSIDGVLFTKDKKTLIQFPASSNIESYMVPDRVTEISDNAFAGADLERLYISVTIVKIGNNVFPTYLKELDIAGSLTNVGKSNLPSDVEKMVFYNGSSGFGNLLNGYLFVDESGTVITDYDLLSGGIYETNSVAMAYAGAAGEPPSRPVDPWIEISGNPLILIVAAVVIVLSIGFIWVFKKRLFL